MNSFQSVIKCKAPTTVSRLFSNFEITQLGLMITFTFSVRKVIGASGH